MRGPREPFSGFSHLVGLILSFFGLYGLLKVAHGSPWHVVSFSIFGASLILLYAASSLYHLLRLSEKGVKLLRRFDHMMIYVLIAGSYTPFCLIPLRGPWGFGLLIPIWLLTIAGVITTAVWFSAPRWLSTLLYTAMGWLIVVATRPLINSLPPGGFTWLLIGGLFYSVGAVVYGLKWPRLKPGVFGFHELWHIFVMAGSISHFWTFYRYVAIMP